MACEQDPSALPGERESADQIEDHSLGNWETRGLSHMRLTIGRIVAAPAADGTPAEGDDA